jgi:hypothetical protein
MGLALLIIMAEISRLSGSILDTVGQAWSFNELARFGSLSSRAGWRADFTGAIRVRGIFLAVYVAMDLAFILIYWTLIRRFWKRRFEGVTPRNRLAPLLILVGTDVIEDVLTLGTIAVRGQVMALWVLSDVLAAANTVKSLACVAVVFVVMRDLLTGGGNCTPLVERDLPTGPSGSPHCCATGFGLGGVDHPGNGHSRSSARYCTAMERRTTQLHSGGWLCAPRTAVVYCHTFPGWSNENGRRSPFVERTRCLAPA